MKLFKYILILPIILYSTVINAKKTALRQAIPHVGLPNSLTTINLIKETEIENDKPIYE